MELRLSCCGSPFSSNVTKPLHRWSGRGLKHQPATSKTIMVENMETEGLGMLTLLNADILDCACGILCLLVPAFLRCTLKQLNSKEAEGGDDRGCSTWRVKLQDHPRINLFKKSFAPFRFKQKSELIENFFDSNQLSQNFI